MNKMGKREKIRKMIQNRINFLIKKSQPLSVKHEDWKTYRTRINELDWVLSLFTDIK